MTFEEFENADARKLRELAMSHFDDAQNQHMMGDWKAASLIEAQFYMQELDRRESSRIGTRDFRLELVVIGLIGLEIVLAIVLAIVGTRQQSRDVQQQIIAFGKMQEVLGHLEESSKATASTLTTLETTTETMNGSLQKELALFYDVSINMFFDADKKQLLFVNNGRTNVSTWGIKAETDVPVMVKEGRMLPPGGSFEIDGSPAYNFMTNKFPKPTTGYVKFEFYIKNERGEEFVEYGALGMQWEGDVGKLLVQIRSIVPEKWSNSSKHPGTNSAIAP